MTDNDNLHIYNYHRNRHKELSDLLGCLNGVKADGRLVDDEILFLSAWLQEHDYLHKDPDVLDLVDCIDDILADGVITTNERQDLMTLINTVLKYRGGELDTRDDHINLLIGFVKGINADNKLNKMEVDQLTSIVDVISDEWPASLIASDLKEILKGEYGQKELDVLRQTLDDFLGFNFHQTGMVSGLSTSLPVDQIERVLFEEKSFCFTGKFAFGSRSECVAAIRKQGGRHSKSVTRSLDYLVIGELSSEHWSRSNHGRKIERAIDLKQEGQTLYILSEKAWRDCL